VSKRQSLKNDGTSAKKIDPAVLTAIIGGIVTITATLITVLVPIIVKPKEVTTIPITSATNSLTGITTPSSTANDLLSMAMDNLNDVKVINIDTFDNLSVDKWTKWNDSQSGGVDNGTLKLTTSSNESAGFERANRPFVGGQGILLRFKGASVSGDHISFDFTFSEMNLQWPQTQQFEMYDNPPWSAAQIDLHYGENSDSYRDLVGSALKPDTWYDLLMVIDSNTNLLAIIWDPNNPTLQIQHEESANPDWLNLSWVFGLSTKYEETGTLYIDDFTEISFSSIK
jgi:hypothetical protein